jgi:hypothetical protein
MPAGWQRRRAFFHRPRAEASAGIRVDPQETHLKQIKTATDLRACLAESGTPRPCDCGLGACTGWETLKEERWPAAHIAAVATLRDPDVPEPSFEERHPDGTRYDSPGAPVAVAFFPYNRSDLWRCTRCDRHLLRYTEFGGYYVDHRVRELGPDTPILD